MKLARKHRVLHNRSIDDFADHIITRNNGRVLDCGFKTWVSDPDFAIGNAAARIRANAAGSDGKGPYDCLRGYDLHYRLMPHWERKERYEQLGVDPDYAVKAAVSDASFTNWEFSSDWLVRMKMSRHMEFFFNLVCLEQQLAIDTEGLRLEDAFANAIQDISDEIEGEAYISMNLAVSARVQERLAETLRPAAAPEISI